MSSSAQCCRWVELESSLLMQVDSGWVGLTAQAASGLQGRSRFTAMHGAACVCLVEFLWNCSPSTQSPQHGPTSVPHP